HFLARGLERGVNDNIGISAQDAASVTTSRTATSDDLRKAKEFVARWHARQAKRYQIPPQHSGTNMVVFLKQERLIRARPDTFSIRSEVNPQPKLNLSRRAEGEYARAHPNAVDIVISVSCHIDGTG